ncbi:MAG: hypothetical protein Ct9H300mP12_09910 [Acidimicrobiales bacterium]|nr:MAG: hypothetical protein Ct9H300mP12_09910 [Acidimicrobiales bacterium]
MADRTPAWREVYGVILKELVARHTEWWAASDWLTQFGPDPDRNLYPENWRPPIPETLWGTRRTGLDRERHCPLWRANGPHRRRRDALLQGFFGYFWGCTGT